MDEQEDSRKEACKKITDLLSNKFTVFRNGL
jgi:hypothetical protein